MKTIQLSQGRVALVDDHWFEQLSLASWSFDHGYARAWWPEAMGKRYMHQVVKPVTVIGSNMLTDHIDGNKLNNQEANLRHVDAALNIRNRKLIRSRYKGIKAHYRKWIARAWIDGKERHLGLFGTEEEAARAYDAAVLARYGNGVYLNFPNE